MLSVEEARRAARIPDMSTWPELAPDEAARRAQLLDDIARRVAACGVRRAAPSPDRGRLFMPFAALKGYDEVVAQAKTAAQEAVLEDEPGEDGAPGQWASEALFIS